VPGLNAGRADFIVAGLRWRRSARAREPRDLCGVGFGIRKGPLEVARVMPKIADPGEARHDPCATSRSVATMRAALAAVQKPRSSCSIRSASGSGARRRTGGIPRDAAWLHDVGFTYHTRGTTALVPLVLQRRLLGSHQRTGDRSACWPLPIAGRAEKKARGVRAVDKRTPRASKRPPHPAPWPMGWTAPRERGGQTQVRGWTGASHHAGAVPKAKSLRLECGASRKRRCSRS